MAPHTHCEGYNQKTDNRCWQRCGEVGTSYTTGGNLNGNAALRKNKKQKTTLAVPQKVKDRGGTM